MRNSLPTLSLSSVAALLVACASASNNSGAQAGVSKSEVAPAGASTASVAQSSLLPSDLRIVQPIESLSQRAKLFVGKWEGGLPVLGKIVVVVEEVTSESQATVVFASQRSVSDGSSGRAGWSRVVAELNGARIAFTLPSGLKVTCEQRSAELLEMTVRTPSGELNVGLHRVM